MAKKFNFDINDPLADILSNGSDDSFFDDGFDSKKNEQKPTTSDKVKDNIAPAKVPSVASETKKESFSKSLSFDAKEDTIDYNKPQSKPLQANKDPPVASSAKTSKEKIPTTKGLDLLDDLGMGDFDQRPSDKNKAPSIFDDILGGNDFKKTTPTTQTIAKDGPKFIKTSTPSNMDVMKTAAQAKIPNAKGNITEKDLKNVKPKTITVSKQSDDWLGMFPDGKDEKGTDDLLGDDIDNVDSGMPSWLMGKDTKKQQKIETKLKPVAESKPKEIIQVSRATKSDSQVVVNVDKPHEEHKVQKEFLPETRNVESIVGMQTQTFDFKLPEVLSSQNAILAPNMDIAQEGAMMYMQQQESQLMVALQLKAQADKLAAMQKRQHDSQRVQKEAMKAHQSQLDVMLAKQSEHRRQMQEIIMKNQEQVNNRIKALLGQASVEDDLNEDMEEDANGNVAQPEYHRSNHTKAERHQLMQLVQTLQENHNKEADLMETSYRRQLGFVDLSLNHMEERLKGENEKLISYYTDRIKWLELQQKEHNQEMENKFQSLVAQQKYEISLLQERHSSNIDNLQKQHVEMTNKVRDSVVHEQSVIDDSTQYSKTIKTALAEIKTNSEQCAGLLDLLKNRHDKSFEENEKLLQTREAQVNEMITTLNRKMEYFEREKEQNTENIKLLEGRMIHMTKVVEDEHRDLEAKRVEFEYEKSAFKKQSEKSKSVHEEREEEIKILRAAFEKECLEKETKINSLKQQAQAEIDAIRRDKMNTEELKKDIEKIKIDLQNQIDETAEDRSRLNSERQKLQVEELNLIARGKELDTLMRNILDKESHSERRMGEAEFVQRKYEERSRRIQEQVLSLNNREKQIAREKLVLSRERLQIHNTRRDLESRPKCSLCNATSRPFGQYSQRENYPSYADAVTRDLDYDIGSAQRLSSLEQQMKGFFEDAYRQPVTQMSGRPVYSNFGGSASGSRQLQVDQTNDAINTDPLMPSFKESLDPKLMLLKMDVQQVINSLTEGAQQGENDKR